LRKLFCFLVANLGYEWVGKVMRQRWHFSRHLYLAASVILLN